MNDNRSSVALCTPSRGLLHSRTVASIIAAVNASQRAVFPLDWWHLSHDLPIPDSHNAVAAAALATHADFVLFIEEDNVLPANAIDLLLAHQEATGCDIVAIDYPVGSPPQHSTVLVECDEVLWCALGCTLISRRVFDVLDQPWFSTSRAYVRTSNARESAIVLSDTPVSYGGLDIDFAIRSRAKGFMIGVVPGVRCGHLKLERRNQSGTNDGSHTIVAYHEINYQRDHSESEEHFTRRCR